MSNEIVINIPPAFKELFKPKRYKVYWGGRGSGKSWAFALALLILASSKRLRILCVRELQVSIADSVHKLIADLIGAYNLPGWTVTQTSIRHACGSEFIFKGLKHNLTEIKSTEGVDIVWAEEAEKISSNSWEVLIPTIRKEGSEIWISFNAKNPTDATYIRFVFNALEDAVVKKVSWRDNPYFPEVLRKEKDTLQRTDPEAYKHIWEGEFDTRYFGGIYSKWMADAAQEGRIRGDLFDPALPVFTAWDLGRRDATTIWWFQRAGNENRIIDYYENTLENMPHYCGQITGYHQSIKIEDVNGITRIIPQPRGEPLKGLERRREYKYGNHYVPHDARNKLLQSGGLSIIEIADAMGVRMSLVQASSQQNQIEAARATIPECFFDGDRCKRGIECLNQYQFEYDEDRKVFKNKPDHNWASHGADAFEILALVRKGVTVAPQLAAPRFLHDMTAAELFAVDAPQDTNFNGF